MKSDLTNTASSLDYIAEEAKKIESNNSYVYWGLGLLNILMFSAFLFLGGSVVSALVVGLPIGISFSVLVISTVHVGSRMFWINFAWFFAMLVLLCCFGFPEGLTNLASAIGIPDEILVAGSLLQAVFFYMYVGYHQYKDYKRSALKITAQDIRIDTKLSKKARGIQRKEAQLRKPAPKRMKLNKGIKETVLQSEKEPEIYSHYRIRATYAVLGLLSAVSIYLLAVSGLGAFLSFAFIAMFLLTLLLLLVTMIKPGTKKFWIAMSLISMAVLPFLCMIFSWS